MNEMNYKLEKFWNPPYPTHPASLAKMNYKLEKFWNLKELLIHLTPYQWTINLKSFEIMTYYVLYDLIF